MAVIREYKAACGATVRIDDECFWPADEQLQRKAEADRALIEIFVRGYLSRQAACARQREAWLKAQCIDGSSDRPQR